MMVEKSLHPIITDKNIKGNRLDLELQPDQIISTELPIERSILFYRKVPTGLKVGSTKDFEYSQIMQKLIVVVLDEKNYLQMIAKQKIVTSSDPPNPLQMNLSDITPVVDYFKGVSNKYPDCKIIMLLCGKIKALK